MPNKIKLFACGGAATNIISAMFAREKNLVVGGADMAPCYIDTSRSNLNPNIKAEQLYIVDTPESSNGSGKVRKTNAKPIQESIPDILLQFKPEDINIVVASTGGGTGSVCGPLITSELLKRGLHVIVISVGTYGSEIEVRNSLRTIESYEGAAQKNERPVPMAFFENGSAAHRPKVDQNVITMIQMLSVLLSGHNHGLDDQDVKNFLEYQHVTSFGPHLVHLDVFQNEIEIGKGMVAVTVASLTDEKTGADLSITVGYQCEGVVPTHAIETIGGKVPLHFVTVGGYFSTVTDSIKKRLSDFEAAAKAVMQRSVSVDTNKADDTGLVL